MSNQSGAFVTGDGRLLNAREIADIYRNCVDLAVPTSGRIQCLDENHYSINCRFSTTDCDRLETVKTSKTYSLETLTRKNGKERYIASVRCLTGHQAAAEILTATSSNSRYLARLNSSSSNSDHSKNEKKQFLELWDRSRLLRVIDVANDTEHGPINTDQVFSSMAWYPFADQNKLIYVCQRQAPKYQGFFDHKFQEGKRMNLGDDHTRVEDWGESLDGIDHTLIAVLDVGKNFSITKVDVEGYSLADVRWLEGIRSVSVAYKEEPRRLGVVYCNNRPSMIIVHDWNQSPPVEVLRVSNERYSYHTPRVDHSGKKFLYLMNPTFGAHFHAVKLHIHDFDTNQDKELVDESRDKRDLFITDLPENCFTNDDKHVLFVDVDYLQHHLCLFDLIRSKITRVKFPTTGLNLLDFKYDVILAAGSEVNATPTLFVAALSPVNPAELFAWHQIEDSTHLDEIEYSSIKIPTLDQQSFISTLFISPVSKDQLELPTVIMLHGGPQSAFATSYMPAVVFYSRLGLRALLINYRGSIGVSEEYSKSLCGKVGKQDVEDCLHAIRHFVTTRQIDPKKLVVYGGSHGGFLACHLSCQSEFKFTSAIIRNPVVDISTLYATSDIPDWSFNEALGHSLYNHGWMPSSSELADMFACSPISKYREANVPTLMVLGTKDRRVNMYQGERWVELLKANGVKVKCKVYADKHDLARVEVSADCNMSIAMWILENLST